MIYRFLRVWQSAVSVARMVQTGSPKPPSHTDPRKIRGDSKRKKGHVNHGTCCTVTICHQSARMSQANQARNFVPCPARQLAFEIVLYESRTRRGAHIFDCCAACHWGWSTFKVTISFGSLEELCIPYAQGVTEL